MQPCLVKLVGEVMLTTTLKTSASCQTEKCLVYGIAVVAWGVVLGHRRDLTRGQGRGAGGSRLWAVSAVWE